MAGSRGAVDYALGDALNDCGDAKQVIRHVEVPVRLGHPVATGALAVHLDVLALCRDAEPRMVQPGDAAKLAGRNVPAHAVALDPLGGGDSTDKRRNEASDEQGKVVFKDGALQGYSTMIVRYLDDGITVIVLDNITGVQEEGALKFAPLELAAEIAKTIRDNGVE